MRLIHAGRAAVLRHLTARTAILVSLVIWWLNVALTIRWAQEPGSVHGPKRPLFLAALLVVSLLAVRQRTWAQVQAPQVEAGEVDARIA